MPEPTLPQSGEPTGAALKVERRAWVRNAYFQETSCHPVAAPSRFFWSAKVQDLSPAGIGLLLDHRFEPGTLLTVSLQGPDDSLRSLSVRVVHETFVTAHPGLQWLIGCTFVRELTDEEFQALLP